MKLGVVQCLPEAPAQYLLQDSQEAAPLLAPPPQHLWALQAGCHSSDAAGEEGKLNRFTADRLHSDPCS